MARRYARKTALRWKRLAIGKYRSALVLPECRFVLFANLVAQRLGREDFHCRAVLGDIEQQLAVIGIGEFKNIGTRLIK